MSQKIKGPLPKERPEVDYGAYSVNGEGLADCSAGSSHHEYGYSARAAKGAEGPMSLPGTKSTAIPVRLRKQLEPSSLPGLRAQNENSRPRSAPRRLALDCYPSPCERCFTPAGIYVKRWGLWTTVEAVNISRSCPEFYLIEGSSEFLPESAGSLQEFLGRDLTFLFAKFNPMKFGSPHWSSGGNIDCRRANEAAPKPHARKIAPKRPASL